MLIFEMFARSQAQALIVIHIFCGHSNLQFGGTRAKAVQAVAESWSAGFACKRKQSLHSRCRLQYVTMDIGLHRSGDGLCILAGVPQPLVYKDESSSLGIRFGSSSFAFEIPNLEIGNQR